MKLPWFRYSRKTGEIVIEQTDRGWRFGVAHRRLWLFWRVESWSRYASGMDACLLMLAESYLKAAQTLGGVRLRRGQRKRLAVKIAAKVAR